MSLPELRQVLEAIGRVLITAQPVGWLAIGIIVVYMLATMMRALRAAGLLAREHESVRYLEARLDDLQDKQVAVDAETYAAIVQGLSPGSLASHMVRATWRMRGLVDPSVDGLLQHVRGYVLPQLASLRSAPNTLLLIGLFGTVAGLGATVAELAPQLRSALFAENPMALTESMSNTLHEMQSTFAATLWGILSALVTAWIVRGVMRRHQAVVARAQDVFLGAVAPSLLPSSTAAQMESLSAVLYESRDHMANVAGLMETAATRFQGVLEATGSTMTSSIDQLASISDAMRESLTSLSHDVQASAASLDNSTRDLRSSAESLKDFHGDMHNAYSTLQDLFRETQVSADRRATEQLDMVKGLQEQFGNSTQDVIARLRDVRSSIEASAEQLRDTRASYIDATTTLLTKIEAGFDALDERLDRILERHTGLTSNAAEVLAKLQAPVEAVERQLSGVNAIPERVQSLETEVRAMGEALAHLRELGPIREHLLGLPPMSSEPHELDRLGASVQGMRDGLTPLSVLPETIGALQENLSTWIRQANERLDRIDDALREGNSTTPGTNTPSADPSSVRG